MSKKTFVTKEQIEEIVKTWPTPFHLYDEKGIRQNAQAVKEAFAWNPRFPGIFCGEGESQSIPDQYSEGVWLRGQTVLP